MRGISISNQNILFSTPSKPYPKILYTPSIDSHAIQTVNSEMPEISPLTMFDATVVSRLAGKIWRHHYAEIISPDQIDYMLAQRYCPLLIKSQVSSEAVWWQKMTLDETIIGFSCYMRTDASDALKIDKLYIDIDHPLPFVGRIRLERREQFLKLPGAIGGAID